MEMDELGQAVKNQRKALGLSQEAVASVNGMSRVTLSNFENGKLPELGVRKLMAVCSTLGLELVLKEATSRPTLRDLVEERGKNA